MRWIRWSQVALVGVLALGVLGLTSCAEDEPSTLRACEEGGQEKWDSCYDFTHKAMHCVLEPLRAYYAEGRYELDELPEWVITRERNGAPIIFDIRATGFPLPMGQARGVLLEWARGRNLPINDGQVDRCIRSMTEAEIREAEGGARSTTEWDFDEPVATP